MTVTSQHAHLTFKGNSGVARHGWLRLTPAYGVRLVEQELERNPDAAVVLDPFSGTGTTGLCAATDGRTAHLVDLNPFLIWLATTKTRHYGADEPLLAMETIERVRDEALESWGDETLWQPELSNIERWWSPSALAGLRALRAAIDRQAERGVPVDLMLVAFCQTLIRHSAAAFNHQSMSFKNRDDTQLKLVADQTETLIDSFRSTARSVIEECELNPSGETTVHRGDSRQLGTFLDRSVDLLVTSPPYCNRMSYIRELRPYMYWLRFLDNAREAGDLDWRAIGGTWGVATSRLLTEDLGPRPPLGAEFDEVVTSIATAPGQPNAKLLSNYVYKYFVDMWHHIRSTADVMETGGRLTYIVGNSTFFGILVPTERWYAELLSGAGYTRLSIETIRKRNSNKLLYEFAVRAEKSQLR